VTEPVGSVALKSARSTRKQPPVDRASGDYAVLKAAAQNGWSVICVQLKVCSECSGRPMGNRAFPLPGQPTFDMEIIMKISSLLKSSAVIAGAVFAFTTSATISAQGIVAAQALLPVGQVSLVSFDPAGLLLNATFPAPITLHHSAIGSPSHYRVSRFPDFRDAAWLPYTPRPTAQIPSSWFEMAPGQGGSVSQVVLHFQVRAANVNAGRPISVTTNPLSGVREVRTQPDFINSAVKSKTILSVYAG
jgi:hypothetical protein